MLIGLSRAVRDPQSYQSRYLSLDATQTYYRLVLDQIGHEEKLWVVFCANRIAIMVLIAYTCSEPKNTSNHS